MNVSTSPATATTSGGYNNNITSNATAADDDDYAIGATIVSPITMCLAGIVGNVLALVVLQKTKTEVRRMMFYTLVAALALTDLTGILLTTPVTIAAYINRREMPGGDGLCKFNAFIMVCFGLATPLIVCAMAVERFLAITCTYFYSKHCTPHNGRITVVFLWAFVFFFGALPLFGFGDFSLQYPHTWCFLNFRTADLLFSMYAYLYAAVNLCIVVLMTCCNVFVMITLLRVRYIKREQGRNSISSSLLHDSVDDKRQFQAQMKKKKQKDVEMQMIWLMCAITTIFAVCWAPLMIHIILTLATQKSNPVLGLLAIRLASLNQTLDPWLYILLRKAFLKKIRDMAKKAICSVTSSSSQRDPQPECRCNQYVHVRRQLCHRNYFVGNNSDSSDAANRHTGSSEEARARSNAQEYQHTAGKVPDAMKTDSASKREDILVPDVTQPVASDLDSLEFNSVCNRSSVSDRRHSDSQEGIYVDIFRIVPTIGSTSKTESEADVDETSRDVTQTIGVRFSPDVESDTTDPVECSSSGIFSLTQSGPSNDVICDHNIHSDVTPVNTQRAKQSARRTKSYT